MALPRPPPLAESIRLPGHIFHHVFERPSVGAKGEGEPFSCYRAALMIRLQPLTAARILALTPWNISSLLYS
jgi:hypothetical protein